MRATLLGLVLLLLTECAGIASLPYRAKLYGPSQGTPPRAGSVIAQRADGALLFQFDDHTEGDGGYLWVTTEDGRYRLVRFIGEDKIGVRAMRPVPEVER